MPGSKQGSFERKQFGIVILPEKCSQNCGSPDEKCVFKENYYLIIDLTYGHGSS